MKTLILFLLLFPVLIFDSCKDMKPKFEVNINNDEESVDEVKDLGGFFDPVLKVLFTTESDQKEILEKLNSEKLNDSQYVMPWKSISGNSMNINFQVLTASPALLFLYVSQADKNLADFFANRDSARADFITEFTDSTGTYARIYKNGKCAVVTKDTTSPCYEQVIVTYTFRPTFDYKFKYYGLDSFYYKNTETDIEISKTGKYVSTHQREIKNCLKGGNNYCVEELVISRIENLYSDKDCRQLLEAIPRYGYSCR